MRRENRQPDAGIYGLGGCMAGLDRRWVYRWRRWRYRSKSGCVHGWTDGVWLSIRPYILLRCAVTTPLPHREMRNILLYKN
jgi:hypothetical protein